MSVVEATDSKQIHIPKEEQVMAKRQNPRQHSSGDWLEMRQLMSGISGIQVNLNAATRTLSITGTESADDVSIQQNDALGTLTVQTKQTDGSVRPQEFAARSVARVFVNLAGRDDLFRFETIGGVRTGKDLQLDLGAGDDTVRMGWADEKSTERANLTTQIDAGAGNDAIGVRIGQLAKNVSATLIADRGAGNEGFVSKILNPSFDQSRVIIAATGGTGDDELAYWGSGRLSSGALVNLRFDGQSGNDSLNFKTQGRIDGRLTAQLIGGADDDDLSAAAVKGSGVGHLNWVVDGGDANDSIKVELRSEGSQSDTTPSNINGGAGDDLAYVPAALNVRNVETQNEIGPVSRSRPIDTFDPILRTQTLETDGRTVEYWSKGTSACGAPVTVLISGGGESIDTWQPIVNDLGKGGLVIAVNKSGYGVPKSPESSSSTALHKSQSPPTFPRLNSTPSCSAFIPRKFELRRQL